MFVVSLLFTFTSIELLESLPVFWFEALIFTLSAGAALEATAAPWYIRLPSQLPKILTTAINKLPFFTVVLATFTALAATWALPVVMAPPPVLRFDWFWPVMAAAEISLWIEALLLTRVASVDEVSLDTLLSELAPV